MDSTVKRYAAVVAKIVENADGSFDCRMTSPTVDRVGDVIEPEGGDFAAFTRNPQLAYGHDAYGGKALPIGAVNYLRIGKDFGDANFRFADEPEITKFDEFPLKVKAYTKCGYLRSVSIGFRVLESERNKTGGFTIKRWEMLELSIVMIPANADAMIAAKEAGTRMVGLNEMAAPQIAPEVFAAREAWVKKFAAPDVKTRTTRQGDPPGSYRWDNGEKLYDATSGHEWATTSATKAECVDCAVLAKRVKALEAAIGLDEHEAEPSSNDDDLLGVDEVDDSPLLTEALAALDPKRLGD